MDLIGGILKTTIEASKDTSKYLSDNLKIFEFVGIIKLRFVESRR